MEVLSSNLAYGDGIKMIAFVTDRRQSNPAFNLSMRWAEAYGVKFSYFYLGDHADDVAEKVCSAAGIAYHCLPTDGLGESLLESLKEEYERTYRNDREASEVFDKGGEESGSSPGVSGHGVVCNQSDCCNLT
jgi:hypothetical protein